LPVSVLLLLPSRGLGGGIERYTATLHSALVAAGEQPAAVTLTRAPATYARRTDKVLFAVRALRAAARERPEAVLAMHVGLLPVLCLLRLISPQARFVLFFYGSDIWGGVSGWERFAIRRWRRLELATISSYSAGAVSMLGKAPEVLRPALDTGWHAQLSRAARPRAERDIDVLTVCRLAQWEAKGIPAFLAAVGGLSASGPVRAVIAGTGPVPAPLEAACEAAGVELRPDLDEAELASLYGRVRVFVLCTVLATGLRASGEGFGIVLLEAQAAGACVVAPRSGGSSDAYVAGVTGWRQPPRTSDLIALLADLRTRDVSRTAQEFVARGFSQVRLQADLSEFLHPV
jgi:phosphatidyl-myo-inositol dimannoside synthase